jgi:hypothetical protein
MNLMEDLELETYNPDAIDAAMEAGGVVPKGKYHARLENARDVVSKENSNDGVELEFKLLASHFAGQSVKDTIWVTDNEKAKARRIIFMHRLGLLRTEVLPDGKKKYVPVQGKEHFRDVLGVECVIDVDVEEYEIKDKDTGQKTGRKGKSNRLAFCGVYALDDPKLKDVERAGESHGSHAANGTNGKSAAGQDGARKASSNLDGI